MSPKSGSPVSAIICSIVVAGAIVYLVGTLSHQVMPYASGLDATDPAQLKLGLEAGELPLLGMLLVLGGWLLGAYAGGRVAISIGKQEWVVMTFAVLFTVGIVMNLLVVPSPTWMWIGGAGATPLFALGAGSGRS
ncbi:MAG: hypothetical protein IPP98_12035 [Gemmatimonadetes bacterium]|nr:hypothetical protein [Gemmatimonadota bacterium]